MNASEMTDTEKAAHIRKTVLQAGKTLRAKHPWLDKYQNHIGAGIMLLSLLGMMAAAGLYIYGLIAWYVCVPMVAVFASFIHELEHDLIHQMYFKKTPWANDLMLALGWIARASTISPFVRRALHLHHHKYSGTESDLEERGITNGYPWGLRRLLMTGDNMLSVYLRPQQIRHCTRKYIKTQIAGDRKKGKQLAKEQMRAYLPLGQLYYILFHSWLVVHIGVWVTAALGFDVSLPAWMAQMLHYLDVFAVVYMLPNLLRTFCLHFISSNIHYYGDVEAKNVMQQCQVMNVWWLFPFQLFCFNFGSTHAIHHFAVKEPFYIRQWTSKEAHKVMREMGVRFNDFGTFFRANRFEKTQPIV